MVLYNDELIEEIKNSNDIVDIISQYVILKRSGRNFFGLCPFHKEKEPEKIEQDLLKTFDKKDWKDVNHLFVWHGRYTCVARNPKCEKCTIKEYCNEYKKNNK